MELGRYKTGKSNSSFYVLQKLGAIFEKSADFLMNGGQNDSLSAQFADKDLLKQFKAVQLLSPEDKTVVKTLIDALITKRQLQHLVN